MNVEIILGDGDKRAPDIVDELITTDACAIQRGRNHLYENSDGTIEYELEIAPLLTNPLPGSKITVYDSSLGAEFESKVLGYMLTVENMNGANPAAIKTSLQIERQAEDE